MKNKNLFFIYRIKNCQKSRYGEKKIEMIMGVILLGFGDL